MNESTAVTEKRADLRHPCAAPILLLHLTHSGWREVLLRNCSGEGLCIETPEPFSPGSFLFLRLTDMTYPLLSSGAQRLLRDFCMVSVQWCHPGSSEGRTRYEMGVKHLPNL
jgi:hypothetical protein